MMLAITIASVLLALACALGLSWALDRLGEMRSKLSDAESARYKLFEQLTRLERQLGDVLDENDRLTRGAVFSAVFPRTRGRRIRRVVS